MRHLAFDAICDFFDGLRVACQALRDELVGDALNGLNVVLVCPLESCEKRVGEDFRPLVVGRLG